MNCIVIKASLAILSLLFISPTHADFRAFLDENVEQYAEIQKLLDKYKRPITVLELDAHSGYYSLKIAQHYKAFCCMTEEENADKLLELCKTKKSAQSLMLLKKKLSLEELVRLGECEHFDVVLMMQGVESYQEQWKETLDAVLELGEHTFIQVPMPDKFKLSASTQRKIYQYLKDKSKTSIETSHSAHSSRERMALFLFSKEKKTLKRKYWTFKKMAAENDFIIESNFLQKIFRKRRGNKTLPWQPGINLITFKTLNGIYPSKDAVREKLAAFKGIKHTDLHIWNVIIQGSTLIPIDGDDKALHYNPRFTLQHIINQFKRMLVRFGVLNEMDIVSET